MATLDPIDELLNRQIPEKLWHYTSVQGFQGIVTSKTIFATDTRFLNDRKEFIHAREIASEVVADTPDFGPNLFPARDYLEMAIGAAFDTGLPHPNRLQVFVASFSAAEDQLSQWRGYSQGSSGVSLAFQLGTLRPSTGSGTLACFAPCVYRLADKKELLSRALSHFMKEAQAHWDAAFEGLDRYIRTSSHPSGPDEKSEIIAKVTNVPGFRDRLTAAMVKTKTDLLRVAALLKDESFHEEEEWRLVLPMLVGKEELQNPPRFRTGNTTLVPYIAFPLASDPSTVLPLVDVILGPGSHPSAVQAATAFLESEGISIVPRESKVPYRPW
jgi:hypothetical protein